MILYRLNLYLKRMQATHVRLIQVYVNNIFLHSKNKAISM